MSHEPLHTANAVPRWLIYLGSAAIGFHLLSVVTGALAAPSGPWPSQQGPNMSTPPQFAFTLNSFSLDKVSDNSLFKRINISAYLTGIKMEHNYHFPSNRPATPGAYLEVRLKNDKGEEIKRLKLPNPDANGVVRYHQEQLVRGFADDQFFTPSQSERIAGPGKQVLVEVWESDARNQRQLHLTKKAEHLIPKEGTFRPSDWSKILAGACARHLCAEYGASSAEIIRHTQEAMPPAVLFMDNVPAGTFDELISNFGEYSR
jgi:hypothetical protein